MEPYGAKHGITFHINKFTADLTHRNFYAHCVMPNKSMLNIAHWCMVEYSKIDNFMWYIVYTDIPYVLQIVF